MISRQWYHPYGSVRASTGALPTDIGFTGQREESGLGSLYDYNARYCRSSGASSARTPCPRAGGLYPCKGDWGVPEPGNPQALNRYAYTLNNPVKYIDPSGHIPLDWLIDGVSVGLSAAQFAADPTWENAGWLALDIVLAVTPYVPAGVGLVRGAARAANVAGDVANTAGDAARVISQANNLENIGESIRILYHGTNALNGSQGG